MAFQILLSRFLLICTLFTLIGGLLLLLLDKLWENNHNWHLSHSKLLTCKKCGTVFQLPRQAVNRRCPKCGGPTRSFQMPYSGLHGSLTNHVRNLDDGITDSELRRGNAKAQKPRAQKQEES